MSKRNEYSGCTVSITETSSPKIEFPTSEYDRMKTLCRKFNKGNIIEKKEIAKEFPNGVFPICRFCGNLIVNSNFKLSLSNNYIQLTTPAIYCREINGIKHYLSCCEDCLRNEFGTLPLPKYYFMKANKYSKLVFDYSEEEFRKICASTTAVTIKSLIAKYGETEGKLRWERYKQKQSESNSFEYKQNKYGWDKETFDVFNKSRAVTKENLIRKYGEAEGSIRWEHYIDKQKETKSFEYMSIKYGEEHAIEINKSKAITLKNFIKKFGEAEGTKRYAEVLNRQPKFYSKISQECFDKIDAYLGKIYTTYYATKNTEYGVNLGNRYVCLDYYIKELKTCIEFNGTVFHADKRKYKATDRPNPFSSMTAQEIWECDSRRYSKLEALGIKVIVIEEIDYRNEFNTEDFLKSQFNFTML